MPRQVIGARSRSSMTLPGPMRNARSAELQSGKQEGQRFILSPQQQEELENFRKKEAEAKTQLKEVRRETAGRHRFARESNQVARHFAGMPGARRRSRVWYSPSSDDDARCPMNSRQLTPHPRNSRSCLAAIGWILFIAERAPGKPADLRRAQKLIEFPLNDVAHHHDQGRNERIEPGQERSTAGRCGATRIIPQTCEQVSRLPARKSGT